jgi:FkbM family methyltransferase
LSAVEALVEPLAPSDEQLDADRVVDVEADVGSIWLERHAELMTPSVVELGYWAADITSLMRHALRPGMTFVDAGANIGYFSVLASKLVGPTGRVFSIEVDPANVAILRANLWRNGAANAQVLPVAAWDENTHLNLRTIPEGGAGSSVAATGSGEGVAAFRVDELIPGPVDYMKVDCESTDHMVVKGAERLIRGNPSMITTVEFNPDHMSHTGHTPAEILDIYRGLGLKPYLVSYGGHLKATSFDRLVQAGPGDGSVIFDFALTQTRPTRLIAGRYPERVRDIGHRVLKLGGDMLEHVPERIRPKIRNRDRRPAR